MSKFAHLLVRNPKDDETPLEASSQIFSSLLPYPYISMFKRLYNHPKSYSFEIYLLNQTVYFYVTTTEETETLVSSLVASSFPKSNITRTEDPMEKVMASKYVQVGEMVLNSYSYLPIKTYADFKDIDPLSSLLGFLAKQSTDVRMAVQIVMTPATFAWQAKAVEMAGHMIEDTHSSTVKDSMTGEMSSGSTTKYAQSPQKMRMMQKAGFQGGKAVIRLVVGSDEPNTAAYMSNLAGTFGTFSLGEGNQFVFRKPLLKTNRDKLTQRIKERKVNLLERKSQVLNAQELGTIWHPPGFLLAGLKNIAWGKTLLGEPPQNLPTVDSIAEEEKKDVNFFAHTDFKNKDTIFGIKTPDRRKHVYVIGKTGAGKSTLIANMAIDDIRKDRGIGIIDPHGDLSEIIMDYIPKRRINDVVYLEPFDAERPFSLNVLEVHNSQHKDLVASGIVSIFHKIYGDSWGPRLEYILRNVILTLLDVQGGTLIDALRLLSDDAYRSRIVPQIKDEVLRNFWEGEFARMPDKLKAEAVSPIQNKVGQFVSSRMIRNIIGNPNSSINLQEIMDSGKILILNLSQGKLGEDNAALLGAMVITQIQLAAMNRSFMKEEDRRDFFLYVDEFQNFATSSFTKILSEARKYRLSLTLANQYSDQLDETIQNAIYGNVGTLMSFVVGATDAYRLTKEYAEIYSENDLVSLGKFEIVLKLSIDNMTSAPFPAITLPLPNLKNENREAIIRHSKERYGRKPQV
ncbi:MAG TPA: type IV secretion system DNA-binding domain-containing protein [Patescibacteria group bacterium]|nr:type IV secretion system DNA-binding domain-containing protein [Patescibacteria group bacterium]